MPPQITYALVSIQCLLITRASSSNMIHGTNDAVYRKSNKKGPHSSKNCNISNDILANNAVQTNFHESAKLT